MIDDSAFFSSAAGSGGGGGGSAAVASWILFGVRAPVMTRRSSAVAAEESMPSWSAMMFECPVAVIPKLARSLVEGGL